MNANQDQGTGGFGLGPFPFIAQAEMKDLLVRRQKKSAALMNACSLGHYIVSHEIRSATGDFSAHDDENRDCGH